MPAHLVAGSRTLRNVNASEIKPRKKLLKKKSKTKRMQKTSQVKFQLTFLLTAQKAVCVAFILLHSPSFSCSHNLSHSAAEERENAV